MYLSFGVGMDEYGYWGGKPYMEIHVRLHGILRDRLPKEAKGHVTLVLGEEARLKDLIARLSGLGVQGPYEVAVDGEVTGDENHPLAPGDEVDVFRPAAGGTKTEVPDAPRISR